LRPVDCGLELVRAVFEMAARVGILYPAEEASDRADGGFCMLERCGPMFRIIRHFGHFEERIRQFQVGRQQRGKHLLVPFSQIG